MLGRFTAGARRVVVLASEEARTRRHACVTPEHLLLGILRDGRGLAVHAFQRLGIGVEPVKAGIERALGSLPGVPANAAVRFAPRTKRVLELAVQSGRALCHRRVGTDALLLALVEEADPSTARILASHGLTLDQVRQAVIPLLGAHQAFFEETMLLTPGPCWQNSPSPAPGPQSAEPTPSVTGPPSQLARE